LLLHFRIIANPYNQMKKITAERFDQLTEAKKYIVIKKSSQLLGSRTIDFQGIEFIYQLGTLFIRTICYNGNNIPSHIHVITDYNEILKIYLLYKIKNKSFESSASPINTNHFSNK
jgi:hypothetical protein